jgi:hypothetical protein
VIDPRGPRFGAAITSVVLAAVVLTGSPWLLLLQALLFGYSWLVGVQASPYGRLYRKLIRPRLGPPVELEDPRPPRFAQLVGFLVTAVGWVVAVLGGGWGWAHRVKPAPTRPVGRPGVSRPARPCRPAAPARRRPPPRRSGHLAADPTR